MSQICAHWKLLAVIAFIMALFMTVTVYTTTLLIIQNQKISAIEKQLAHEARVSDIQVYETLLQEIRELEKNVTDRALQLEMEYSKAVRTMQEALNDSGRKILELESKLSDAEERITKLEEKQHKLLSELEQTKGNLSIAENTLYNAKEQISQLERNLSNMTTRMTVMEELQRQLTNDHTQTREQLNSTREIVHNARASITVLEDGLNDTKHRTSVVEGELANTKMEVSSLNETKASKVSVDQLTERLVELEIGKVDKTEFEDLSDNVTSLRETTSAADKDIRQELSDLADTTLNHTHYDQLQDGIQHLNTLVTELKDSTVRTSDFLETVNGIHNTTFAMQRDIEQLTNDHSQTREELNETRERLHNAATSITVLEDGLNDTKHRTSVVEDELANTKMEVSSLNESQAQLTRRVEELEIGKVDRTEFEVLSDNVTSLRETTSVVDEEIRGELSDLADNTVRTSDFLETVGSIYNTTVVIQTHIVQLTQRLTSLAHNTTVALSTKADQHEVNTLSEQLTTLSEETVRKTTFQSAIDSLSTSKAEQSDLDSLEGRVDHLEDTTAKKDQLSSLEHEVTNHISGSQSTHNQLSSRIGSNDDDIESNRWRIGVAESDIDQLQADVADSSPGLKPLWTLAMVPAMMIIVMVG